MRSGNFASFIIRIVSKMAEVSVKKILLFGATGKTGRQILRQALNSGHKVTAVARNPASLEEYQKYDNLEVKQGDVLDRKTFQEHMSDCDVVMSGLGPSQYHSIFSPMTFYTDSMLEIHEAMKTHGITRLVVCSSWATQDRPDLPFFIRWILRPLLIRSFLINMDEMEQYLLTTDLNYTVCRPPGLTNEPPSGKEVTVRVDGQHVPNAATTIPRADVAAFMLKCLNTDEFDKKMLAIGFL